MKKLLVALLVAVSCVSCIACGGQQTNDSSKVTTEELKEYLEDEYASYKWTITSEPETSSLGIFVVRFEFEEPYSSVQQEDIDSVTRLADATEEKIRAWFDIFGKDIDVHCIYYFWDVEGTCYSSMNEVDYD